MDLICVGNMNLDISVNVKRLPCKGEEIEASNYYISPGGSALNTAVSASKLGLDVGIIGCVGKDLNGSFILKMIRREKVNVSMVKIVEETMTGVVVILVLPSGQRTMIALRGANRLLSPEDLKKGYLHGNTVIHVAGGRIEVAEKVFKLSKDSGSVLSFDPGFVQATGRNDKRKLKKLLGVLDLLFLNEEEFYSLTGTKDLSRGGKNLLSRGLETLVVKLGEKGAYILSKEAEFKASSFKIKVKDTTGAGDAFNAGFITGYIRFKDLRKAATLGSVVAALKTTRMGAASGMPSLVEVNGFLHKNNLNIRL